MIKKKKVLFLSFIILFTTLFYGCDRIDQLKIKLGMKNNDFEYIKQGKIKKIIIQNIRDPGFRFVVTDKKAIAELYDILSKAKETSSKSELSPDYIFEMEEGTNKVYKFNYIAGLNKEAAGNLYSEDKMYLVSKRIDNDIIKSFWNIRMPKDFAKIYYGMILDSVKKYSEEESDGRSIGINIYDDVDIAKFILSTDLEEFKYNLSTNASNAELMEIPNGKSEQKQYDININVKTVGYKAFLYKSEISFWDKQNKVQKKYYVTIADKFKDGRWTTKIDTQKPREW